MQHNTQSSLLERRYQSFLNDPTISIISFDIFDTLLMRDVSRPEDIFLRMGEHPEIKTLFFHPSAFQHYRVIAEHEARKRSTSEEITHQMIYDQMPYDNTIRQRFIQIEIEEERRSLFANRQIETWIRLAISAGKKVILTSDIYLSKQMITTLIREKTEIVDLLDNIFISSEYDKTKATGRMFELIFEHYKLPTHRLLHIGDNEQSDVEVVKTMGASSLWYACDRNTQERFDYEELYQEEEMFPRSQSRRVAALDNPFSNERERFFFDFGATIGGPLLWEFSHWILTLCHQRNIDQVNFIMREGRIFHNAFKHLLDLKGLSDDYDINLLYASRRSTLLPSLDPDSIEDEEFNFYRYRRLRVVDLYSSFGLSITDLSIAEHQELPLSAASSLITSNGLSLDMLIAKDLRERSEELKYIIGIEKERFTQYLHTLDLKEKSLLIDFGGTGTILQQIDKSSEHTFTHVLFFMHEDGYRKLHGEHALSFLPLTANNHTHMELLRRSVDILETLFNGLHGTTTGYTVKGPVIVPLTQPVTQDTDQISAIEAFDKGILSFFESANTYHVGQSIFTPESLLSMISRSLEVPTAHEATMLGSLQIEEDMNSSEKRTLIDEKRKKMVTAIGVEKLYQQISTTLSSHYRELPWPHGTITALMPDYIRTMKGLLPRKGVNSSAITLLLEQLENTDVTTISIYGAGDFFTYLLPELEDRQITIDFLIDSRAETRTFTVHGYEVVTARKAFQGGADTFLIASAVFTQEIIQTLTNMAQESQREITIFSIHD